jgi:hypothetical protein
MFVVCRSRKAAAEGARAAAADEAAAGAASRAAVAAATKEAVAMAATARQRARPQMGAEGRQAILNPDCIHRVCFCQHLAASAIIIFSLCKFPEGGSLHQSVDFHD